MIPSPFILNSNLDLSHKDRNGFPGAPCLWCRLALGPHSVSFRRGTLYKARSPPSFSCSKHNDTWQNSFKNIYIIKRLRSKTRRTPTLFQLF